jgi:hypothetical protein
MNTRIIIALIKQLTALALLHQTTQQGYSTMNNDLQSIGATTAAEYELHKTYFGSLDKVNPAITNQTSSNENNVSNAVARPVVGQGQPTVHR